MRLEPLYRLTFRYAWLDGVLGAVAGEVRDGREIVLDVAEFVWEPLGATITP